MSADRRKRKKEGRVNGWLRTNTPQAQCPSAIIDKRQTTCLSVGHTASPSGLIQSLKHAHTHTDSPNTQAYKRDYQKPKESKCTIPCSDICDHRWPVQLEPCVLDVARRPIISVALWETNSLDLASVLRRTRPRMTSPLGGDS